MITDFPIHHIKSNKISIVSLLQSDMFSSDGDQLQADIILNNVMKRHPEQYGSDPIIDGDVIEFTDENGRTNFYKIRINFEELTGEELIRHIRDTIKGE